MNKNGKILHYSERVIIERILLGNVWLITGVSTLYHTTWSLVMLILSLSAIVYSILKITCSNVEAADEMAEQNINKAKSFASDLMRLLSCCAAILAILFLRDVTLTLNLSTLVPAIVFFVMGCHSLITGLAFRKFEGV